MKEVDNPLLTMHQPLSPQLTIIDESGGDPRLTTSTCTSNPMDIILNLMGHIEIDHMSNIGEIQTLSCHISSHQHIPSTRLELTDGFISILHQPSTVENRKFPHSASVYSVVPIKRR